jgi:hypothetical protein
MRGGQADDHSGVDGHVFDVSGRHQLLFLRRVMPHPYAAICEICTIAAAPSPFACIDTAIVIRSVGGAG